MSTENPFGKTKQRKESDKTREAFEGQLEIFKSQGPKGNDHVELQFTNGQELIGGFRVMDDRKTEKTFFISPASGLRTKTGTRKLRPYVELNFLIATRVGYPVTSGSRRYYFDQLTGIKYLKVGDKLKKDDPIEIDKIGSGIVGDLNRYNPYSDGEAIPPIINEDFLRKVDDSLRK